MTQNTRFKILETDPLIVRDYASAYNYHLGSTEEAKMLLSLLINLSVNTSNHTVLLARLIEENGNLMDEVTRLEVEVQKLDLSQYDSLNQSNQLNQMETKEIDNG